MKGPAPRLGSEVSSEPTWPRDPGRRVTGTLILSTTSVCQFQPGGLTSKELRKMLPAASLAWAGLSA